ncbi:small heat shock protein, chloroplastic-like [Aristolochia californica]|uniref:small heat shock protein, chloroplastic-like n=1 Tax=Aristolochia californica TaxID=171875 RepID=UPI0035E2A274
MSSSFCNLSISPCLPRQLSRSCGERTENKKDRFPPPLQSIVVPFRGVKPMAMAGERRPNLDHLQRASRQPQKGTVPVAPVGRWDRFPTARTIQQMIETMERILEDPLAYSSLNGEAGGTYRRGRTPWEIKEGETEYKMRFDMPGMTKNDVKIWVEEKMLVVKAEKQPNDSQGEEAEEEWSAWSYGRYSSRIALPDNVETEKIKAEVKDGVLYIIIPKAKSSSKVLDIDVQ